MKKIIVLISLMLSLFATAQEVSDTMYICRNDYVIERIAVSKIDSVTFVAPVVHTVSVAEEANGDCSILGIDGTSATIIMGKEITVVATPAENHFFLGWFVSESEVPVSIEPSYTFTVNEDIALVAKFEEIKYVVSVAASVNGTVAIEGKDSDCAGFVVGSVVSVIATPDNGYGFLGWFASDCETAVSTDATYTFTVGGDVTLFAKFEKIRTYLNGYEYIDLGLPSGTKWAAYNVGATAPEEYGGYYAWGETEVKDDYSPGTYKYGYFTTNNGTEYFNFSKYREENHRIDRTVLEPADDVAHVKWGGGWRMPTMDECIELCENCTCEWVIVNGVGGYELTGLNGNAIFLPVAGHKYDTSFSSGMGYYWSSTLDVGSKNQGRASYLSLRESYGCWLSSYYREYGMSVRPVCE